MSSSNSDRGRVRVEFLELMAWIGSVTEVARRLGINRNTAYAWARKAGLRSRRVPRPGVGDYLDWCGNSIRLRSRRTMVNGAAAVPPYSLRTLGWPSVLDAQSTGQPELSVLPGGPPLLLGRILPGRTRAPVLFHRYGLLTVG